MKWILLLWVVVPQTSGTVNNGYSCTANGGCVIIGSTGQVAISASPLSNMRSASMDRETCLKTAEAVMALNADVRAACQPGRE